MNLPQAAAPDKFPQELDLRAKPHANHFKDDMKNLGNWLDLSD